MTMFSDDVLSFLSDLVCNFLSNFVRNLTQKSFDKLEVTNEKHTKIRHRSKKHDQRCLQCLKCFCPEP